MYKSIDNETRYKLVYHEPTIKTPFHNKIKIVFADYTASGRPCPLIEKYMETDIMPYYSNTHSNAYCGILMKNKVKETREYLKKILNIKKTQKIIFTGNGATGAINHLVYSIDFTKFKQVNILVSIYEHYSNYIPWVEASKVYTNITVHIIPLDQEDDIDIKWLDSKLGELNKTQDILNIVSITGCSNVTGIITPIDKFSKIINKYNSNIKNNYFFVDFACSAPYKKIDGNIIDAFFISPHKFIGGVSTPGILVADKTLFMKDKPYAPGGGCVKKATCNTLQYEEDLEKKESGGTPDIYGIIKLKKVFELKEMYTDIIENNEKIIVKYIYKKLTDMTNKYNNLQVIFLNKCLNHRLPIISISINGLHYNYIVVLLNDLFGIQTRGGVSCCGVFGELINKKYGINGWCRISFHWIMKEEEIENILKAIEFITKYGKLFSNLYVYDKKTNIYTYNSNKVYDFNMNTLETLLESKKIENLIK
jgi:selenocysteine lyase/cysteine desulfurase